MKIEIDNLDEFNLRHVMNELNRIKDKESPHVIYAFGTEQKRSMPQNRYYWGVVLEDIADQTGNWPDEIHDFNKKNFGVKTMYFIGDEAAELIKGLSKMGRKRATEFINRVIEHWASKGITIREPDQLTMEEFHKAMLIQGDD